MIKKLKEKIRNFIKEEVSKNIKYFQLENAFDLTQIPEKDLSSAYHDISLTSSLVGFDSPLFKHSSILENDCRVTPANEVKNEIFKKYHLADWQFKIFDKGHDIQICVCIANLSQGVNEIINDFKQMGYFLSYFTIKKDTHNRSWKQMQFEPLYQTNETEEILYYGDLYHLTPEYNLPDITTKGIIPKCDNKIFYYPNRVYLFMGNATIQKIKEIGQKLSENNKNKQNNGEYVLLRIDAEKIRNKIKLYFDPNLPYGAFTEEIIPPDCFEIIQHYKFKIYDNNNK